MNATNGGANASPANQGTLARSTGPHWGLLPSATVVGRSQVRLTGREARSAAGQSTSPRRPRAELANPAGPQAANTEAVALNPSPPVVSVDTIPLPLAPVLPKTLTFVFSGLLIASCVARHSELPNAPRVAFCQRANLSGIGAKILVMHFCCFVRRTRHHDHLAEWSSPLDADGQQAAAVLMPTCRPGSSVLMAFSRETSATRRKWPRTHPHRR
jgi:hypothetical protein